jgi:transcriptional regulator with XRE-family HTH domain
MALRGDRLQLLRNRHGISQDDLAARVDVSLRQLQRYESGDNDPAGEIVNRLATVLQTTSDYLLGRTDDPLAQISEDDLSQMERLLLDAYRRGDFRELMRIASEKPDPEPER